MKINDGVSSWRNLASVVLGVLGLLATARAASPPAERVVIQSVTVEGGFLNLSWIGGVGPFTVQSKPAASDQAPWMDVAGATERTGRVAISGGAGFFRVLDLGASGNDVVFSASLSGAAERPNPVDTNATGSGSFFLQGNVLDFNVSYRDLSGPAIAAHIHGPATAAQAAGVLIDLGPFNGGAFDQSGTLAGSVELTEVQRQAVVGGLTYVNIHTELNPPGEIRGQIARVLMKAEISGAQEVPPVSSDGSGTATMILVRNELFFNVQYSGLTGPAVAAHIHGPAGRGENAGVMIDLEGFNGEGFGPSGVLQGKTFVEPDQLAALVDGLTYLNIHTANNPPGEIRGQIDPDPTGVPMSAVLSGAAERPEPVETLGLGNAKLRLNGTRLAFNISYSGLSGPAVAAHIHGPAPTSENAGVLIDLEPFNGGGFAESGSLAGSLDLNAEQRAAIMSGLTYINLHTELNPSGEIRGQIAPVLMKGSGGGQDVRPVPITTQAQGTGIVLVVDNVAVFDVAYRGLSGPPLDIILTGPATREEVGKNLVSMAQPFKVGELGTAGGIGGRGDLGNDIFFFLIDGLTYLNFPTEDHPEGEIRGQIVR